MITNPSPIFDMRHSYLIALLLVAWSNAALALKCDEELIQRDAYRAEVELACGRPFWTNSWFEASVVNPFGALAVGESIHISQWYYHYGPDRLMRRLSFRNGRLVDIETLGYGVSGTPGEGDCDPGALGLSQTMGEVVARCGLPAFSEAWNGYRALRLDGLVEHYQQVRFETWAYDFGPNHFTRYVTFANGRVVDVDMGERGSLSD